MEKNKEEQFTLKNRAIEILKGFGLILMMALIPALIVGVISSLLPKNASDNLIALVNFIAQVIYTGIFVAMYFKLFKNDFKKLKENGKQDLKSATRIWFICFVGMFISLYIINTYINPSGISANEQTNRNYLMKYPIYGILSMVILGPIVEEIVFRAGFKKAFKKAFSFAIFGAILFGSMHLLAAFETFTLSEIAKNWKELLYIIPYGFLGFGFNYIYHKTDNIHASIIAHILHNAITVLIIFI